MNDLHGWTPIRVSQHEGRPVVDWCWTDGVRFEEPFFDQTIDRCLRDPYRLLVRRQTPVETLGEWAQESPGLPLAGLVLHMSRCGSTLVTQMLAARGDVRVMSEPGPFDALMRLPAPLEERARWLRWLVSALGQGTAGEQRTVLKLDAWAALDLPLLKTAFPDVPRLFLFRNAAEVLVSQSGHRGYHMIPGGLAPSLLGLDVGEVAAMSLDAYGAAVLGAIVGSVAGDVEDPAWLLVPYEELPGAVADSIAARFGLSVDDTVVAAMEAAAGRDAKNPVLEFSADVERKRAAATAEMLQECAVRVDPHVRMLLNRAGRVESR